MLLNNLTLKLLIANIVVLEGYANSETCPTLLYTRCNYSDQVLLCRKEPTFIQKCRSSLESQVLDFTHTNKDGVYRISSWQQFRYTLCQFYHDFLEKTPMTPKSIPVMKKLEQQ